MQNPSKIRLQIISWIIAAAILALLFGIWTHHNLHNFTKTATVTLQTGTLLPQPKLIQAFDLKDTQNKPFTNQNLKARWTMLFFGFTHCPQLCPTTLSVLNQVYTKLQQDRVAALPQVLFVSVDPDRDSAGKIKRYLASFNPNFIGARGDEHKIAALTKEFNVVYAKVMLNAEDYSVDHSGTILLIDPAGQLYAIFSTPHDANIIASDYEKIIATATTQVKPES